MQPFFLTKMTMKKSLLLIPLSMLLAFSGLSQHEPCKTTQRHEALMQSDASYRQAFESALNEKPASSPHAKIEAVLYKIPVVVHVLHVGTAVGTDANISDEQIYSAIESMNNAYRKKAGTTEYGNGADAEIEFCLAQRDPNGIAHSGINRVNASSYYSYGLVGITDANESQIKALSKWPNTQYYNIWIVTEIDDNGGLSGVQGYAYYPEASSTFDGSVILYNAFGYDPDGSRGFNLKSYTNFNRTAIHEIGHALNLRHTFQGDGDGSSCPGNLDCNSNGDQVCDTPPHKRSNSNCLSGNNECTDTPRELFIHNYMDYSSERCQDEFTNGQITRMRAVLSSGARASLVSATNLANCGCSGNTAPISRFTTDNTAPCQNSPVQFIDQSLNFPASWSWSFVGGTPATSTLQNPSVSFNGTGPYAISLTTTSSEGVSRTMTKTGLISPTTSAAPPFLEDFEGTFPPAGWKIESTDNLQTQKTWAAISSSGNGSSTKSAYVDCYNYTSRGQIDDLLTPPIGIQWITNPSLSFEVSHTLYSTARDTLEVAISPDCGTTWTTIYSKSGTALQTSATKGANMQPSSSSHWRAETGISLNSYLSSNAILRFRVINDYGGNIYIDNVSITGTGYEPPTADFFASQTEVSIDSDILFSSASQGVISSYQWDFGQDAISSTGTTGAGPHSVSYSSTGLKTVTLTVTNPEDDTDTKTKVSYIAVLPATSVIPAHSTFRPQVYPNPATGEIRFRDLPSGAKVSLVNQLGETVHTATGSEDSPFSIAGLAKGLYMVLIQSGEMVHTEKLVIQP